MRRITTVVIAILSFLLISAALAQPFDLENAFIRIETNSGHDDQGDGTIVNGQYVAAGKNDVVWYGEYEYVYTDFFGAWAQLTEPRANFESGGAGATEWYSFDFPEVFRLIINKKVTLTTIGTEEFPVVSVTYTVRNELGVAQHVQFYDAIDWCDGPVSGNTRDRVYELDGDQVMFSGWTLGNGLYIDTGANGIGVTETTVIQNHYAGYWHDALYGPIRGWDMGEFIDDEDAGIGVHYDVGDIPWLESAVFSVYYGFASDPPWPTFLLPPTFPSVDAGFTIAPETGYELKAVEPEPHVAIVSTPAGQWLTFDASASYTNETSLLYIWDFGDGTINTMTTPIIQHRYTRDGAYNINLTVIDDKGKTGYAEATIRALIPVGGFQISVDKFSLLTPIIGLASTVLVAAAATIVYVKRNRRKK